MSEPSANYTLFSTCKPFRGAPDILQRNALSSWRALGVPVMLLGSDQGTREVAEELGVDHISDIAVNDHGRPLISSLFETAERFSKTENLCYLNSDILMSSKTADAVSAFLNTPDRPRDFLYVTRRRNIPLFQRVDGKNWDMYLAELDAEFGTWDQDVAVDMFAFNKGWMRNIPPFAVGRPGWDSWMLSNAKDCGAAVVDGSLAGGIYHPLHDYYAGEEGLFERLYGPEAIANQKLVAFRSHSISSAATLCFNGQALEKIPHNSAESYHQQFSVEMGKKFASEMYRLENLADVGIENLFETLKAILWNMGVFCPNISVSLSKRDCIEQFFQSLKSGDIERKTFSTESLQDIVLQGFIDHLRELGNVKKKIYIWGASLAGRRAFSFMERHSLPVQAFIDQDPSLNKVMGKDVLAPAVVDDFGDDVVFIIGSTYFGEIQKALESSGYNSGKDYFV